MDNVTFVTDELTGDDYAIIDRGNGEFTSMTKETYDAQRAAQDTLPSNSSIPQAGE
jgi:hypothetical protein